MWNIQWEASKDQLPHYMKCFPTLHCKVSHTSLVSKYFATIHIVIKPSPVADLIFWKEGFQYGIKACVVCLPHTLRGSGGIPPRKYFDILNLCFWCMLAKVGWPTAKLSCFKPAELKAWLRFAPQRLVICVYKAWENKCSHTDGILPSLAAEGAMHDQKR